MTEIAAGKLAQDLESVTQNALDWIRDILKLGVDEENPGLMRAQSSAANIAINAQLRADALRLRAQRDDKALKTLMDLIAAKELQVPSSSTKESCAPLINSLGPPHGVPSPQT